MQQIFIVGNNAGKNSQRFLAFTNPDGKTWWMPRRNMLTALNLYQPSGWKGKLLKACLPAFSWFLSGSFRCAFDSMFEKTLCRLFDMSDIEFSVFFGTPSVHQKTIIQLSRGNKILGYCKVTDKKEIAALFEREAEVLGRLHECGIEGIPQCLFAGEWQNGIYLFVQNTVKSNHSHIPHRWSELQETFLTDLYEKTKTSLPFEETDFHHSLMSLKEHLDWLPNEESRKIINKSLSSILLRNKGKTMLYSAYHADFTPWNMFVEDERLVVFDWEYARMTYPPMLDKYHFFVQTAIFEKHLSASKIVEALKAEQWVTMDGLRDYLTDIIARFTIREQGNITSDVQKTIRIWLECLTFLSQR